MSLPESNLAELASSIKRWGVDPAFVPWTTGLPSGCTIEVYPAAPPTKGAPKK